MFCQCGLYISTQVSCAVSSVVNRTWLLLPRGSSELQPALEVPDVFYPRFFQGMTERKLRSLLESTVTEHSQRCFHSPEFTVTSGMEEEASLLMSCPVSLSIRFLHSTSAGLHSSAAGQKAVTPGVCSAVFPQTSLGVVLLLIPGNCRAFTPHLNRGLGTSHGPVQCSASPFSHLSQQLPALVWNSSSGKWVMKKF